MEKDHEIKRTKTKSDKNQASLEEKLKSMQEDLMTQMKKMQETFMAKIKKIKLKTQSQQASNSFIEPQRS